MFESYFERQDRYSIVLEVTPAMADAWLSSATATTASWSMPTSTAWSAK